MTASFIESPLLRCKLIPLLVLTLTVATSNVGAAARQNVADVRELLRQGKYEEVIKVAAAQAKAGSDVEEWRGLEAEALLATGAYSKAVDALKEGIKRAQYSIPLRVLLHEGLRMTGQPDEAAKVLDEINDLGGSRRWMYRDAKNMIALGEAALLLGGDPRVVLDNFFNPVKKADPDTREAYLAIGRLALQKNDLKLASQVLEEALKRFKEDPDLHHCFALALQEDDRNEMMIHIEAALAANPRHVPSFLLLADHMVDAEEYKEARETLEKALKVNPRHPRAWGYIAVLAHLNGAKEEEKSAREEALASWKTNPEVDHIMGKKLSQKYRFTEGAARQRSALEMDPDYLPAKGQLAQDLLRLGDEDSAWALAEEVRKQDEYDVMAYNLGTLKEVLEGFETITNEFFAIRMSDREADIYGRSVTNLLLRARNKLVPKYGAQLDRPTMVEIFPEQKDFAIRTFGLPGGEGFLGVCFGPVITANSPVSQTGTSFNWEAMLWHEFCHVVTLRLTKNKMPRWLSEGISVYEERQENPAWGQVMTPRYHQMILKGELKKIAELSSAFLSPPTPGHLQFAYYQSALVVEFLVKEYGLAALRKVLLALGDDIPINSALDQFMAPMDKLESGFSAFAEAIAKESSTLDFGKPTEQQTELPETLKRSSNNYWVLNAEAKNLASASEWDRAIPVLKKLIERYPLQRGEGSAYEMLATASRKLSQPAEEKKALVQWAELDGEASEAYARLLEIGKAAGEWDVVEKNARRLLAVNPMIPLPYEYLGEAAEKLTKYPQALAAYDTLLKFDPADPARVHYQLAVVKQRVGDKTAKLETLKALEEAPRFKAALELLLNLNAAEKEKGETAPPAANP